MASVHARLRTLSSFDTQTATPWAFSGTLSPVEIWRCVGANVDKRKPFIGAGAVGLHFLSYHDATPTLPIAEIPSFINRNGSRLPFGTVHIRWRPGRNAAEVALNVGSGVSRYALF